MNDVLRNKSEKNFGRFQVTVIAPNMKKCVFRSLLFSVGKSERKRQVRKARVSFLSFAKSGNCLASYHEKQYHQTFIQAKIIPLLRMNQNYNQLSKKTNKNEKPFLHTKFGPILTHFGLFCICYKPQSTHTYPFVQGVFYTIAVLCCRGMESKIQCRQKADLFCEKERASERESDQGKK